MNLSKLTPLFSPAPWFVDRREQECTNVVYVLRRQDGGTVTIVEVMAEDRVMSQHRRADAQLIAVAPEMFLELVRLRGRLEYLHDQRSVDCADDVMQIDRLLVKASTFAQPRSP